ncbi:hypothetical protein HY632_02290 [Candidatus Uhrbacteria bacterium]|nr:hypothetical protein [Candidatus Uhrbacteria bacterium]
MRNTAEQCVQEVLDQLYDEMLLRVQDPLCELPSWIAGKEKAARDLDAIARRAGIDPTQLPPLSAQDESEITRSVFRSCVQSAVVAVVRGMLDDVDRSTGVRTYDADAISALTRSCIEDPTWMQQHGVELDIAQVLTAAMAPTLLASPALHAGAPLVRDSKEYRWVSDGTLLTISSVP